MSICPRCHGENPTPGTWCANCHKEVMAELAAKSLLPVGGKDDPDDERDYGKEPDNEITVRRNSNWDRMTSGQRHKRR